MPAANSATRKIKKAFHHRHFHQSFNATTKKKSTIIARYHEYTSLSALIMSMPD
jgi:hypothetical protein